MAHGWHPWRKLKRGSSVATWMAIESVSAGLTIPRPGSQLPATSQFGYKTLSIEPSSSHGIYLQLAEGEMV